MMSSSSSRYPPVQTLAFSIDREHSLVMEIFLVELIFRRETATRKGEIEVTLCVTTFSAPLCSIFRRGFSSVCRRPTSRTRDRFRRGVLYNRESTGQTRTARGEADSFLAARQWIASEEDRISRCRPFVALETQRGLWPRARENICHRRPTIRPLVWEAVTASPATYNSIYLGWMLVFVLFGRHVGRFLACTSVTRAHGRLNLNPIYSRMFLSTPLEAIFAGIFCGFLVVVIIACLKNNNSSFFVWNIFDEMRLLNFLFIVEYNIQFFFKINSLYFTDVRKQHFVPS